MTLWRRTVPLGALMLPVLALDQATKVLARLYLAPRPPIELLGGFFVLTYTENAGAALSLGESLPEPYRSLLLTVGIAALLSGVLVFALRRPEISRGELAACGLLLGGGVGNLIDRLLFDGRVTDFAIVGIGRLHTGVFNVADMAIMAGMGMLFVLLNRQPHAPEAVAPVPGEQIGA